MATYKWTAQVEGGLTPKFYDFVRYSDPVPPVQDPSKPKTAAQRAKDKHSEDWEARWKDHLTPARWSIDLGAWDETGGKSESSPSLPEKRQNEEKHAEQSNKRAKLSSTASSQLTVQQASGTPVFHRFQKVRLSCVDRGSIKDWKTPFKFNLYKDDRIYKDLWLTLSVSKADDQVLWRAWDLLTSNLDRITAVAFLGVEGARVQLVLEVWYKNSVHLVEAQKRMEASFMATASDRRGAADVVLVHVYPALFKDKTTSEASPRLFYDSVHIPDHDPEDSRREMEVPGLMTGLYPFQKRTVRWLLDREGVRAPASSYLREADFAHGFARVKDANGTFFNFNPWLQICSTNQDITHNTVRDLKGGILAEEMGLGKTVELISLIKLNQRSKNELGFRNGLHHTAATLVIVPKTILPQWRSELEMHMPELRTMVYTGTKATASKKKAPTEDEVVAAINSHDVVLVDSNVLSYEFYYTTDEHHRSRRVKRVYERRRSPLVMVHWHRIILDEAQQIEGGAPLMAQTAHQLPRKISWAVSGTPLKKDPSDLLALFTFLQLTPYNFSDTTFRRLVQVFPSIFKRLIGLVCLRHTKDQVKADLQLPPQKRVVINVPFTAVEEANYNTMFEQMASECGLYPDGSPLLDTWDPVNKVVITNMRQWLAKLRQVCLHPDVGTRSRTVGAREGPIRTVDEVLVVMMATNELNLRNEERSRLSSMLRRGQMLEQTKNPRGAMEIWKAVEAEVSKLVSIDRAALEAELQSLKTVDAAKEKQNVDGETATKALRLRSKLRFSLELQHTTVFFIANATYQIKTDEKLTHPQSEQFKVLEEEETQRYEEAKGLRRELLSSPSEVIRVSTDKIKTLMKRGGFVKIEGFKDLPLGGGIETRKYVDQADELFDILNQQAELLDEWREKLAKAVVLPLVDQEDTELTGEEYEESTKAEDRIHAYMEAIRLVIADRTQAVTNQKNFNVRREATRLLNEAIAGQGHAPELMKQLLQQANTVRMPETRDGGLKIWLRGTLQQLTQLRAGMDGIPSRAAEVAVIDRIVNDVRPQMEAALKTVLALERELEMFSNCVNDRVEYYRHLQAISDLVVPFEEQLSDSERQTRLRNMEKTEDQHRLKASRLQGRITFLRNLDVKSTAAETERTCIICTDDFDNGVLTSCGHVYCADCIKLWWAQHRNCPTCKQSLTKTDLHTISFKQKLSLQEQSSSRGSSQGTVDMDVPVMNGNAIYSGIDQRTLDEIRNFDLPRSYGTKIDMLARHILWLREKAPGTKSVIFSQFSDFFEVLEEAFDRFRIGWASMSQGGAQGAAAVERFKKDHTTEVLLLHARASAAGLNLVNATNVFLCEPLINTALELQAIARVHRIGQHHETTVWQYLIENTVEKAIYDISLERRLAHLQSPPTTLTKSNKKHRGVNQAQETKDFQADVDAADSLEMAAPSGNMLAKGRSSGEHVAQDDLWPCLFNYRPLITEAASEEAERTAAAFLAGEAAESRQGVGVAIR